MSSTKFTRRDVKWNSIGNLWVILLQLFFSFLLLIPVYYYIFEIINLIQIDYQYVIYLIPLLAAGILFMLALVMNHYFWYNEKIFRKRNFLEAAMKSSFVIGLSFYVIFFFALTWGLSSFFFSYYAEFSQNTLVKFGLDMSVAIIAVSFVVTSFYLFQNYRPSRVK